MKAAQLNGTLSWNQPYKIEPKYSYYEVSMGSKILNRTYCISISFDVTENIEFIALLGKQKKALIIFTTDPACTFTRTCTNIE